MNDTLHVLIGKLRAVQSGIAQSSLTKPQERDLFEYGRVCGVQEGFERAVMEIQNTINAAEDKEERL